MNFNKLSFVLILLSAILISCSSEDSNDTPEPDITEIDRLVKTERASEDVKSDYLYDAQNLLTTWIGTRNNLGYEINISYDTNENLTERQFQETGTGTFSSETIFTYDGNGNLSSYDDVTLSYDNNVITATGTLDGDANITIKLTTNGSGLVTRLMETDSYTNFEYDSNGNMVAAKKYDNEDVLLTTFNIGYDQNENPFFGQMKSIYVERFIEFFYPFEGIFISGFEGYSFPFLKNNIVSISKDGSSIATYSYTYDSENYPSSVDEDYSGNSFQYDIEYH